MNNELIGLDTAILILKNLDFVITDKKFFKLTRTAFVCNPSKQDKQNGIYKPKITFYESTPAFPYRHLLIDVSVPKLIYGNNFTEICANDMEYAAILLQEYLESIHIITSKQTILNANLKRSDFSKNLQLSAGILAGYVLQLLNHSYIHGRQYKSPIYYPNGMGLAINNANRRFILYDKISDAEKSKISEKLCIEKDYYVQHDKIEQLKKKGISILRIEQQLKTRKEVKKEFEKFGLDATFKNAFNPILAKNVLAAPWNELLANQLPLNMDFSAMETFQSCIHSNRQISLNNVLKNIAFQQLVKEAGTDGAISLLKTNFPAKQVNYLISNAIYIDPPYNSESSSILSDLITQFEERKPLNFNQLIGE